MTHHAIITAQMRQGIQAIMTLRRERFWDSPLRSQWVHLEFHEAGIEWTHEHEAVTNTFAWKSQKLLSQLKGA